MIPREENRILLYICVLLLVAEVRLQNGRTYDTNEWIPVTSSSSKSSSEADQQKTASDRVLNLDAPVQKFFPNDKFEHRPNQVQGFLGDATSQKGIENSLSPRPRKIKYPQEYKFETPPPIPTVNQPQINYYSNDKIQPYLFEQPPPPPQQPSKQPPQQAYYVSVPQVQDQRPLTDSYLSLPSINPEAPAVNAPDLYQQYNLPFNASFYQSLNPASINNGFYQAINQNTTQIITPKPAEQPVKEKETVQLVYVPVENLKSNQPASQDTRIIFQQVKAPKQETLSFNPSLQVSQTPRPVEQQNQEKLTYNPQPSAQSPDLGYRQVEVPRQEKLVSLPEPSGNKQERLATIQQDFIQQALQAHKLQQRIKLEDQLNPLRESTNDTPKSKKRKAHQPPLAVFMESQKKAEISDVLNILRKARTISVQDIVTPDSPKIFIGPSNLDSPDGYTKFPLPYLNNINGNRIERKIDQLPFFVAPVSYKTPTGYSKIPLPSPHVGSIVVSVPITSTTTHAPFFDQNQLNPFTFSQPSYIDQSRTTNYLGNNYETLDPGRTKYNPSVQSTPSTHITESPLIPPVRDIFQNPFESRQPDIYYSPENINQQNQDSYRGPTLDVYREPETKVKPRYPTVQDDIRENIQTVRQKEQSLREQIPIPNVNPLELAINNFELQQINSQFVEPTKKVKHSTTRRPQTSSIYQEGHSISSTRTPVSRSRTNYETEQTTSAPSRGRTRGRGRGTSRTTTTTTTEPAPVENEHYTVLEEFVARGPTRAPGAGNDKVVEIETEAPRRASTTLSGSSYLPENAYENTRSQKVVEEPQRTKPVQFIEDGRPSQSKNYFQGHTEIENIPASVYSLGRPQTYTNPTGFDSSRDPEEPIKLFYENIESDRNVNSKSYSENKQANPIQLGPAQEKYQSHRFNPELVSYENREPNQQRRPQDRPTYPAYEEEPAITPVYQTERTTEKATEVIEEHNSKEQSSEEPHPYSDLFQPNYNQDFFSPLQDQAVRSLLVPNLLVPTTRQQASPTVTPEILYSRRPSPQVSPTVTQEVLPSTESIVELPLSQNPEQTTTITRAPRIRGRGRGRPGTTPATVTAAPRRTSSRRRPVSRTSTEKIVSSTEYSSREDSNTKQRFRTRGRPVTNEISDRISTTENDVNAFKEPNVEGGFEALHNREPQSFMQFEQAIDEQQIITVNPNINQETEVKEYHKVYSLVPKQSAEKQGIVLEYDNTNPSSESNLDAQLTQTLPVDRERTSEIITRPGEDGQYVRYNNANIRSGGVLNNKKEETTRTSTTKTRGRTRGRSRFATTTTTYRPVTRISTSAPVRTTTQEEEQERYGFTRSPQYSQKIQIQSRPIQTSPRSDETVQFVGEIRPKYSLRKTTPQPGIEEEAAETPRPRIRARTRAPARKTTNTYTQSDSDTTSRNTEQVTRRSSTSRSRGRGSNHYRAPENLKRGNDDDEDVAGGNYPASFLQQLDNTSPRPTRAFQITVDPLEQSEDDQSPYSSIRRPTIVPKPDGWTDTGVYEPNQIYAEDKPKKIEEIPKEEAVTVTEEPQTLALVANTENSNEDFRKFTETEVENVMSSLEKIRTGPQNEQSISPSETFQPAEEASTSEKTRKRGVWKLVKHKPVDPLETAESQNYQTVLNAFESIQKVDPYSKEPLNEKETNIISNSNGFLTDDNFKNNFSFLNNDKNNNQEDNEAINDEYVVTVVTTSEPVAETESVTEFNAEELLTTPSQYKTQENIFDTIYEMFGMFKKPEQAENSTVITKANNNSDFPTTTNASPTFPEEITEENAATTSTEKHIESIVTDIENISNEYKSTSNFVSDTTDNTLTTTSDIGYSRKPYEVEPWEMRAVKTSTSTEVSHETEICYKGRCIKSRDRKKIK